MDTTLKGEANLLICPNLDAANILFNVLKIDRRPRHHRRPDPAGRGRPVHVLTPSSTVRRVVNMTALAAAGVAYS